MKTELPQLPSVTVLSDVSVQVLENDIMAKAKMKAHAELAISNIQIGDFVLIRQRKQNKLSTKYNPFHVRCIKGPMAAACTKDKYITCNVSHFICVCSRIVVVMYK